MKNQAQDLMIIGGGIMGLMTAYYASAFVKNIIVLDTLTVPNNIASSFSFTRSIRNDYLDPLYAIMSYEAQLLWKDLEKKGKTKFFINSGCLNIAKTSVTPDLSKTYAEQSYQSILSLNFETRKFSKNELKMRFPQFDADLGCLDVNAGFLYVQSITKLLLQLLKQKKVTIVENIKIFELEELNNLISITTDKNNFTAKKIVVTAGKWINDVLQLIKYNRLQFPIYFDKPQECKYFYPPKELVNNFLPKNFPVFAYLDVGIYGHPIFDKKKGAIKIGYYNPPDLKKIKTKIQSIADFINECLPVLKNVLYENVTDADQCSYDLVTDDDFILGTLPNFQNIIVGSGWRGTGYKFAPLIGKILMQLALQNRTVYNIARFSPERFIKL